MIVGVAGFIGSGKDTIADYLITFKGFKRMSYAQPLKDAMSAVFGWDRELLEGTTAYSREWRDQVDPWWADRLQIPHLTPRWVLQQWGTEVGRRAFHDDIWIASVENKLRTAKDNIVLSDCRFPNELKSIKNSGGITIRVSRGANPVWYDAAVTLNRGYYTAGYMEARKVLEEHGVHASEYSSVGLEYDFYVENSGTVDELHRKIDLIINL
jgi:hypothetical protein